MWAISFIYTKHLTNLGFLEIEDKLDVNSSPEWESWIASSCLYFQKEKTESTVLDHVPFEIHKSEKQKSITQTDLSKELMKLQNTSNAAHSFPKGSTDTSSSISPSLIFKDYPPICITIEITTMSIEDIPREAFNWRLCQQVQIEYNCRGQQKFCCFFTVSVRWCLLQLSHLFLKYREAYFICPHQTRRVFILRIWEIHQPNGGSL